MPQTKRKHFHLSQILGKGNHFHLEVFSIKAQNLKVSNLKFLQFILKVLQFYICFTQVK